MYTIKPGIVVGKLRGKSAPAVTDGTVVTNGTVVTDSTVVTDGGAEPRFVSVDPGFTSHKPLGLIGSAFGRIIAWLLVPLVLLLAILFLPFVMVSSNESPIWRQKRVGYRGLDISVPKFSTMNVVASGELRETWFGRLVRPVGLDEILQISLIALGDMQWFGPRPLLRKDIDELYIDSVLSYTKPGFFSSRSLATGMGNRALQEGGISLADMIRYDRADLENWSLGYASRLLAGTTLMVLKAVLKLLRVRS
ncbi:MAG TPA: sugar transferase [Streptosporangiaceae bacterium]